MQIPFIQDFLRLVRTHTFNDLTDCLSYVTTTYLLLFFALLVTTQQHFRKPLKCWTPSEFAHGWESYAENYCYAQNTYYIPLDDSPFPEGSEERRKNEITYYQWIPVYLVLQAMIPSGIYFLWSNVNKQTGVDVDSAIDDAKRIKIQQTPREKQTAVLQVAEFITNTADHYRMAAAPYKLCCVRFGWMRGTFLCNSYLSIKFLYVLNAIGQLALMNSFLGRTSYFAGVESLKALLAGQTWEQTGIFPRVTMCDFDIRQLGNVHRYTVQCLLMINVFNEKIFTFLWFWFACLSVITIHSFVSTLMNFANTKRRVRTTNRTIRQCIEQLSYEEKALIARFAERVLTPDGALVMHFIEVHCGSMVSRDIMRQLWDLYTEPVLGFKRLPSIPPSPVGSVAALSENNSDIGSYNYMIDDLSVVDYDSSQSGYDNEDPEQFLPIQSGDPFIV